MYRSATGHTSGTGHVQVRPHIPATLGHRKVKIMIKGQPCKVKVYVMPIIATAQTGQNNTIYHGMLTHIASPLVDYLLLGRKSSTWVLIM